MRYVLRHDDQHRFDFAQLQGQLAKELLQEQGIEAPQMDTLFVLAQNEDGSRTVYQRSRAVFFCLGLVGGGWSWLRIFRVLPKLVTDGVYRIVAKLRYRLFGRDRSCPIPSDEHRRRFLDRSAPKNQ